MGAEAPIESEHLPPDYARNQMLIVEKYETFINYFYPVAQNIPRVHGAAKEQFIRDMLTQVSLFMDAGKTNQVSRLHLADAGLANLRYWLRFWSDPSRRVITMQQHRVGEVHLSEVGRLLGAWIARKSGKGGQRVGAP